jgi:hypothetical protein
MRVLPRFAKKPEQYLPQRPYAARGGVSTIGVGADGNRGLKGESERYIDAPLGFTFDARKKGDVVWDEIGTASAMLDPASLTLFVDQLQGPFDPFEGRLVHRVAEMFENCAAVPFAALVILAERCKLRRIAIRKSDKVKWNEVARRDPQKTTYGIIRKQYFDFIFSNPPYDDPDQPDYMMIDVPSQKSDSA